MLRYKLTVTGNSESMITIKKNAWNKKKLN